jgi:polysaccharide pyruvyl transferase WcaK-like protein
MVIGSRLHALELSLVAGTSFLAVPYAPKVEHFLTLVDWELPAPVPRHPWGPDEVELVLAPEWVRGLLRARERLREEAEKGIRDVLNWLKQVA